MKKIIKLLILIAFATSFESNAICQMYAYPFPNVRQLVGCDTDGSFVYPDNNVTEIMIHINDAFATTVKPLQEFISGTGLYENTGDIFADYVDDVTYDNCQTVIKRRYRLNRDIFVFHLMETIIVDHDDGITVMAGLQQYEFADRENVVGSDVYSLPEEGINVIRYSPDFDIFLPCDSWDGVDMWYMDQFYSDEEPYVTYKRTYTLTSECDEFEEFAEIVKYFDMNLILGVSTEDVKDERVKADQFPPEVLSTVEDLEEHGVKIVFPEQYKDKLIVAMENEDEMNHGHFHILRRKYSITNPYSLNNEKEWVTFRIHEIPDEDRKFKLQYEDASAEHAYKGVIWLLTPPTEDGCHTCYERPWDWYYLHVTRLIEDKNSNKYKEPYDFDVELSEAYFNDENKVETIYEDTPNQYSKIVVADTLVGNNYRVEVIAKDCGDFNANGFVMYKDSVNFKQKRMKLVASPIAALIRDESSVHGEIVEWEYFSYVPVYINHLINLDENDKPVYSGLCRELTYDNLRAKVTPGNYTLCSTYHEYLPFEYSWSLKGASRTEFMPGYDSYGWFGMNYDHYITNGFSIGGNQPEIVLTKAPIKYSHGKPVQSKATIKLHAEQQMDSSNGDDDGKMILDSEECDIVFSTLTCSNDPNEILGPVGYGDDKMIAAKDRIDYRIYFENDTTATAAAGRVTVHCPLHARADSTTIRLGSFGFGDFMFEVPSLAAYYNNRITETEDSLGVWVDVTAGYDMDNNEMYWIFQSIDPETGVAPIDTVGFLPVNDTLIGNGEGYVSFSVMALNNTVTGDTIAEQATIIFDENDPVETNVYVNKFDAVAPTSVLVGDTLTVHDNYYLNFKALGTDDEGGSGIGKIDVYVNVDHTQYVYATTLESCADSTGYDYGDTLCGSYRVGQGAVYDFIAQATDNVGNTEPFKSNAEFTFMNRFPPRDIFLTNRVFNENDEIGTKIGDFYAIDDQSTDDFKYRLVECEDNSHKKFLIDSCFLYTNYDYRCTDTLEFSIIVECTDNTGAKMEKVFQLHAIETETPEKTFIDTVACFGEAIEFGGNIISIDGDYYDTLQTVHGCDSVVLLRLSHYPQLELEVIDTIHCIDEDFITNEFNLPWTTIETRLVNWTQTSDTLLVYNKDVPNCNDCPQPLQLNMHVYPIETEFHHIDACDNALPFMYGDVVFSEACTKDVYFKQKVSGCDSIVTVELAVHPTYDETDIEETICSNDTLDLLGFKFTTAGYYTIHGQTANHHCDSVVNLTLNVNPISEKYLDLTVCPTDLPMTYQGFEIKKTTPTGLYHDTLTAVNACDSIVTLNLTVREAATQNNDIYDGWNWYSTYLDLTEIDGMQALKDGLGTNGEQIKSHYQFVTYAGGEWMGDLDVIENEKMYMIKANAELDLSAYSCTTEGSDHPITIAPGWNWIGFVSRYSMPLETAMSGLSVTPQEGDIIKSYDHGFAAYYPLFDGWLGSLTQMEPGAGYMYKSNATGGITLTYPTVSGDRGEKLSLLPTHWNVKTREYPETMTFIGKITIDNLPATIEDYEVGVFCDNEVRGSGRAILMEGLGTYRLFMQVYGDQGDELTFRLYDHRYGMEADVTSAQVAYYVPNANYGTINDPYAFRFYTNGNGTDDLEGMSHELTLVPNPANATDRVLLYCDFTPEERDGLMVEVFNALGVQIQQVEPTRYPVQLKEIRHAGAYTVKVTTGTGRVLVKKLVVKR